jgi:integral membrane protein (TIGR01906 family)
MESSTTTPNWIGLARSGLQLLLPVVMVLTSVRLLLTELFVRLEYSLPGFPADRYGFTTGDRTYHAGIALEYLVNNAGIEFLGDQRFADGAPVYNERELQHMEDVKRVTQSALKTGWVGVGLALGLSLLIWQVAGSRPALESLQAGARLTAILMVVLGTGLVIGFAVVFVGFHQVFFPPGTWTFRFEDTLIRLFPERFWQTAFGAVALATLVQAGLVWLITKFLLKRVG